MTAPGTPCEAPKLPACRSHMLKAFWYMDSPPDYQCAECGRPAQDEWDYCACEWSHAVDALRAWLRPAPRPWVTSALHQRHLTSFIRIAASQLINTPTRTAAHLTMVAAYDLIWSHSRRARR